MLKKRVAAHFSHTPLSMSRSLTALLLAAILLLTSVPLTVARAGVAGSVGVPIFGDFTFYGMLWKLGLGQGPGTPPVESYRPQTYAPRRSFTQSERESKLRQLHLNVPGKMTLRAGQKINLEAAPVGDEGETIHGLEARWESSDAIVISVTPDGQAFARRQGEAILTVRVGRLEEQVVVLVAERTSSDPAGKDVSGIELNSAGAKFMKIGWPVGEKAGVRQGRATRLMRAAAVQQEPTTLPFEESGSIYETRNAVGTPSNRTIVSASVPPAAIHSGSELPGSDNFKFSVPVASLPGRGLGLLLNLNYNSRLWNNSTTGRGTRLTYDVDKGWPAPGFNLSYGHVEKRSNSNSTLARYTLIDSDGTRHELRTDSTTNGYITVDGTFIRFNGDQFTGWIQYPNGTLVECLGPGTTGTNYYPSKIIDASGNYILFNYDYQAGTSFRLSSIKDTLGRFVRFYYEGNGDKLIAVTVPGYGDTQDRQTIRFYYEVMPLVSAGAFQDVLVAAPTTARVIRYVYFPGEKSGYRYDYSPYGMIRQITQLRGMTVSGVSLAETGTVTGDGQTAATTTYNYPLAAASLSSAPTYTRRTDDWAGRTAGMNGTAEAPYFTFQTEQTEENVVTTITAPDGTESVTTSAGDVDIVEVRKRLPLGNVYVTYSKSQMDWESLAFGTNRRLRQVRETNEADQTRTTEYEYSSYNNISKITERDFDIDSTTPGRPLRRTKTQYASDASAPNHQAFESRGLLRLPTRVEVFSVEPNGSEVKMTRADYGYDETPLMSRPNAETDPNAIRMHDRAYDPYAPEVQVCEPPETCPRCPDICTWVPQYDPATARRGNLTSVKEYSDAAAGTVGSNKTLVYDIAGNVVSEGTLSCCQQRAFSYDAAFQYAYQTGVTRGSGPQLTSSYNYDYDTGALRTVTDENNQTAVLHYYPETMRPFQSVEPDGSTTEELYFDDQLFLDPDASRLHSAVVTVKSLDANRVVRSWQFFDGRGNVVRAFGDDAGQGFVGAGDSEYDVMDRVYRVSNPYYSTAGSSTPVNPTGKWTTFRYDPIGRVYQTTLPDGNDAQNSNVTTTVYQGTVTVFTDQAGKQRRQTVDALGRVIQMDEPDGAGTLNQATNYAYDILGNLVKVTQGAQTRYFKYDSLSRLTHERQVEQDTPHQQPDVLTGNSWWSRKVAYNEFGQVTDSWDARGIHSQLMYDGLNRLKQVTYDGETTTKTPTVTYSYDQERPGFFNRGKLTTVTTAATSDALTAVPQTSQTYDYDRRARVALQRQTIGTNTYTLGYGYNLAGQLTSQTYPSGRVVNTVYDTAARVQSISDGLGQVYAGSFSYGGHGGLESETWGNGAVHTMTYNDRLQVSQIKLVMGGVERQRFDYSYGEMNVDTAALDTGKNTGQVASIDGWVDGVKQWQQRFAYDKLGRLSTAKEMTIRKPAQAWRVDYTYDRYGNRYQGEGQGSIPVAANEVDQTRNRFLSPFYDPNNSNSPLIVYDAAGNIVIDRKFNRRQYTYDANGRMRRSDASTQAAVSTYDGVGQRVQHVEFDVTRQIVYDVFGQVVADYENNSLKREYVYRGGLLLCTLEADAQTRYALTDHQGSTRAVMNGAQITERHDYQPFGEEIGAYTGLRTPEQGYNAPTPLRRQYAMNERDASTGLDHTNWRKYEAHSGKWTSPDPSREDVAVANPQSFNLYNYVRNDPVNFTDPTGLRTCIDYWWVISYFPHGQPKKIIKVEVKYAFSICRDDKGNWTRTWLPPGERGRILSPNNVVSSNGNDLTKKFDEAFNNCKARRKQERERMQRNMAPDAALSSAGPAMQTGREAADVAGQGVDLVNDYAPFDVPGKKKWWQIGAGVVFGMGKAIERTGSNYFREGMGGLQRQLAEHESEDQAVCEREAALAVSGVR